MKFVKKLYIMTGREGKGAVTVESNAFGTHAEVKVDMRGGGRKYFVFISDVTKVFPMNATGKYDLGNARADGVHVAVVTAGGKEREVAMYGTDTGGRMWQSNLLDLVRGKINDFEKAASAQTSAKENTFRTESGEKPLSIFPVAEMYDDGAIAKVNYYSNIYSSRVAEPTEELLKAHLDVKQAFETSGQSAENRPERKIEKEKDSAEEIADDYHLRTEAAAAATVSDYAKYIYSFRDEMLKKNRETASKSHEPSFAEMSEFAAAEAEKEAIEEKAAALSVEKEAEESVPLAPKADLAKSERALGDMTKVKLNFYERVKSGIDKLFEDGERDAELESLLPSSRFVRIGVEHSDKYYCVGLIGKPDYICYAVPANYTPDPPEELDGYCQWLPKTETNPRGEGYWLIYQDAVTGDSISG